MKNAFRVVGDEVHIDLKFRAGGTTITKIDLADFAIADAYNGTWHSVYNKATRSSYCEGNFLDGAKWRKLKLHRALFGEPAGKDIDHSNHDTLDNRRSGNLRVVSRTVNNLNRKRGHDHSRSGVRGVTWSNQVSRWLVRVGIHGKVRHFGSFVSLDEATARARAATHETLHALLMEEKCQPH
jgi:hypothetical protein